MKKILTTLMLGLVLALPICADDNAFRKGISFLAGWKSLSIDHSYSHNTHPNDFFLPNASTPGSAGTTDISGRGNYLALGVTYSIPIAEKFSVKFGGGGTLLGRKDRRQNANDPRPASNGAFIYSKTNFGLFAQVSLNYHLNEYFYVGAHGEVNSLFIESGWDRFGSEERVKRETISAFYYGPILGLEITDNIVVEGLGLFSTKANDIGFGVNLSYHF